MLMPPFAHAPTDASGMIERLAVALAVGFLVGVERGWRRREGAPGTRAAGLRTFTLAGLYGGLAGLLGVVFGPLVLAAALIGFAAAWIVFELREGVAEKDYSATSTVAGLATVSLGALAVVVPTQVIAASAVALVSMLAFREGLHVWLQKLTWPEIRSALVLLAMTFIVAPILPAHAIDPWGAVVPRTLWWITVLLGAISFVGYVALRALPESAGLTLSALIGAIVSSTAVTLDLARRVAAREVEPRLAAAAALGASAVMLLRASAVLAVAAPAALQSAAPALAAAFAVFVVATLILRRRRDAAAAAAPELGSPLDLIEIARFGAILAALTVASHLVGRFLGPQALLPFAAVAGFADLDAAILALVQTHATAAPIAAGGVLIAAVSNTVLKSLIALVVGKARFGTLYGAASLLALAAGAGTWAIARLVVAAA